MNPMQKVSIHYSNLTKSEQATCNLIIESPAIVVEKPIAEAAEIYQVSPSSIVRLSKKLGYKGYSEFRYALEAFQKDTLYQKENKKTLYNQVIQIYRSTLDELNNELDEDKILKLVSSLSEKNIKTVGIGSSALAAHQLANSLCVENKWAECIDDNVKITLLEGNLSKSDSIIFFTVSASSEFYYKEAKKWKNSGAEIIVITTNPEGKLNHLADLTISLPSLPLTTLQFSKHIRYLENRSIFYAFIDILMTYYINMSYNMKD